MEVPYQALSAEALTGLIEEFVTREGTEYGASEVPLTQKVEQVHQQLARREVIIVFDEDTGTTTLIPKGDLG